MTLFVFDKIHGQLGIINTDTVFPRISARALIKSFGQKRGRLLEGGRLIEGALIKFFFQRTVTLFWPNLHMKKKKHTNLSI